MDKNDQQMVGGQSFPVKIDGMTLVDAYYIPDDRLEEYRRDREAMAEKATAIFKEHCATVRRDFKGSEDGEALLGLDKRGEITLFIHLDPENIEAMVDADERGELAAFLLAREEIEDTADDLVDYDDLADE